MTTAVVVLAALAVAGWAVALWQLYLGLALHPDYVAEIEDRATVAEARLAYAQDVIATLRGERREAGR